MISNIRLPYYLLHSHPSTANHNMQINSSFSEHLNGQHESNYSPTNKFLQNENFLFEAGKPWKNAFGFGGWLG